VSNHWKWYWMVVVFAASFCGEWLRAERPPGTVVAHSTAASGVYLGSPSLVRGSDGVLYACHDLFGPGTGNDTTRVYRSSDRGQTWDRIAEIKGAFWSSLFEHRGALYLLGTSGQDGFVVIRRSIDSGKNWSEPKDARSGLLLADARYHCAPVPVVAHGGRLWRAFEDVMGPGKWPRNFRSFVISIPEGSDLLAAANWTSSNRLEQNPEWLGRKFGGWLEGNVVVTPKGGLANVLRVDSEDFPERAALADIAEDGKTVSFDPGAGFLEFPGGSKKFLIRRDDQGSYWALSNVVPGGYSERPARATRNNLALLRSSDLRAWEVRAHLLHHPDSEKHAFQYPDWQFDGPDLIALVRTAYDDEQGGAHSGHDANFITFHRWPAFRELKESNR
jgi:hypothetical protein